MNRRFEAAVCGLMLVVAALAAGCRRADDTAGMTELQRLRSGALDVVLLSPRGALHQGKDTFVIEFRSSADSKLVDVGTVRATGTMPMPGAPMFGTIEVQPTSVHGRYNANSDFAMAGTWRMSLAWDGPAGKASVAFSGTVQ